MSASGPSEYEVRLRSRRVQREPNALHGSDYRRILEALQALGRNPRPPRCEKLYDDVHRVRIGSWRIVYLVDEDSHRIDVGGIRRRSGRTYQGIEELLGRLVGLARRPTAFHAPHVIIWAVQHPANPLGR